MARAKAVLETVSSPRPPESTRNSRKTGRRRRQPSSRTVYERRYVQRVRSVDLWSVLKVAICFYLSVLIVLLTAGVTLWWIASAAGVITNIEKFIGDIVNDDHFQFLSWQMLRASTLVGLVIVCVLSVLTVLAAAFYNLFSELVGGVEVTVVEQEQLSR